MVSFAAPLDAYAQRLRREHFLLARKTLDELIQRSGVDVAANQATIQDLKAKQEELKRAQRAFAAWSAFHGILLVLLIGGLIATGVMIASLFLDLQFDYQVEVICGGAGVALLAWLLRFCWVGDAMRRTERRVAFLEREVARLDALAWEQMDPLNALFTWDMVTDLLRQVLPEIHLDRMLSHQRLEDLVKGFGWSLSATTDFSVQQLQSGEICGNPFAIVKGVGTRMGEKTYSGSKTVMVRRTIRVDGKSRVTYVPEVLHATVTKPCPEYFPVAFVLFGSEAAPNLSFSRVPSKHSGMEDSFFNRLAKRRTTKDLEAFSRNLDDEYGFTMMANREFETLFYAKDRSDEREFRLLFTPYAQQEMVKLLNDTEIGFGDNFRMVKEEGITATFPAHLVETELSLNPEHFRSNDIVALKQHFVQHNVDYFKAFYFALAPFFTIPLYCQQRVSLPSFSTRAAKETSVYENELIANAYGEEHFSHPSCRTPSILKTVTRGSGDATHFEVTAKGYRIVERADYVTRRDSSGNLHQVRVLWDDYIPVEHTTSLIALPDTDAETGEARSFTDAEALLRNNGIGAQALHHIRSSYVATL